MAFDAHLVELTDRHRALERKIEAERARPLADALKISEWKKQKLRLKEQMERLRDGPH
ncbi:MAG: YdcH family protein [Hyphomicrobiales bacterium]